MEFDPKFLARFQSHPAGVGLADQQVAVAVHPGAEHSLSPFGRRSSPMESRREHIALGGHKGPVEALLEDAATGTDIAAGPSDLVLGAVAQGAGPIQQRLAFKGCFPVAMSTLGASRKPVGSHRIELGEMRSA